MKELRLRLNCRWPKNISCITVVLLFHFLAIDAQESITVLDQEQTPLVGVELFTDDFSFTTTTDLDGKASISVSNQQPINIKYLGFKSLKLSGDELAGLNYTVVLAEDDIIIDEIIVVGRTELTQESLPYEIESISPEQLASTNPQTSADALGHHANVYVQKSQMGGGSPIIRGFEANKVLLVVDGIRLNNAIYRNGHLQNAITVDQAMLERMEVIFGPNSLMYGSDALGGVVHFKSRLPKLNFDANQNSYIQTNFYTRYASANTEKTGHFDFNFGTNKFASLTSVTYSDFGDLKTGSNRTDKFPDFGTRPTYVESINGEDIIRTNDDENLQIGTGYKQFDLLQKFLWQPNDGLQIVGNFQMSTSSDVPRYDQLSEVSGHGLKFAEWYYGPQNRMLGSLSAKLLHPTKFYDKAIYIAAYQFLEEDRIDRRFGSSTRSHQFEDVSIFSFTFDYQKELNDQNQLFYGGDLNFNDVHSTAYDQDINTEAIDVTVLTRYPSGGSKMNTYGIYLQHHWQSQNELTHINSGVRYSRTDLSLSYLATDPIRWPDNFIKGIDSDNSALTWSLGLTQHTSGGWHLRALASTAFRSPNIDDIAKIRVNNDEITFPNTSLGPERSLSTEVSISKDVLVNKKKVLEIGLTVFATTLSDAINREDFTDLNGNSTFVSDGDTLQIVANQNLQKAKIWGFSGFANYQMMSNLKLETAVSYTKGTILRDNTNNGPLGHIPPVYGKINLNYLVHKKWDASLTYRFNGAKALEDFGGSVDNPDLATTDGSLAWSTINLYLNYQLNTHFKISLSGENLMDLHYRNFASGVSAPGRNIIFSLQGSF